MFLLYSNMTSNIAMGDFTSLQLGNGELEMLADAYQAVTKADQWSYLRRSDVPGTRSCPHCNGERNCRGRANIIGMCMCSGTCRVCSGVGELENGFSALNPELNAISNEMKYDGHSGSSHSWCMANMQYIAKNGWPAYVTFKGVTTTPSFARSAERELASFANALQSNKVMRQQIPDIDEQVANIHQYVKAVEDAQKDPSTWKKSAGFPYPCSCHRAQGKEGWCGVAGFGVPGCEH